MHALRKSNLELRQESIQEFDWIDFAAQADRELRDARAEACRLVAQAEAEAAEVRAQARLQGLAEAARETDQKLAEAVMLELRELRPLVDQTVQKLEQTQQLLQAQARKALLEVALKLASRIVRQTVPNLPDLPLRLADEALNQITSTSVQVQWNPQDYHRLQSLCESLQARYANVKIQWMPHPDIAPGGCRCLLPQGEIDLQLSVQLERLAAELDDDCESLGPQRSRKGV